MGHAGLKRRMQGHFNDFGVSGHFRSLLRGTEQAKRIGCKWLCRRSQHRRTKLPRSRRRRIDAGVWKQTIVGQWHRGIGVTVRRIEESCKVCHFGELLCDDFSKYVTRINCRHEVSLQVEVFNFA